MHVYPCPSIPSKAVCCCCCCCLQRPYPRGLLILILILLHDVIFMVELSFTGWVAIVGLSVSSCNWCCSMISFSPWFIGDLCWHQQGICWSCRSIVIWCYMYCAILCMLILVYRDSCAFPPNDSHLQNYVPTCFQLREPKLSLYFPHLFFTIAYWVGQLLHYLDGGFKYFLCSPIFGEMIQFD